MLKTFAGILFGGFLFGIALLTPPGAPMSGHYNFGSKVLSAVFGGALAWAGPLWPLVYGYYASNASVLSTKAKLAIVAFHVIGGAVYLFVQFYSDPLEYRNALGQAQLFSQAPLGISLVTIAFLTSIVWFVLSPSKSGRGVKQLG